MSKSTFDEDKLDVETVMAVEKFKFEVNGEWCNLKNALIKLRNEHDEKVALIEKQTNLTALGLMETARRKVVQGYDKFINEDDLAEETDENKRAFRTFLRDEQYDVMIRMTSLFRGCVDFPKPKKPKKATS